MGTNEQIEGMVQAMLATAAPMAEHPADIATAAISLAVRVALAAIKDKDAAHAMIGTVVTEYFNQHHPAAGG